MNITPAGFVLVAGLVLLGCSQIAIAIHAFTTNPLKGIACAVIPLYIWIYARKSAEAVSCMRAWYLGVAMLIAGGVAAS